MLDVMQTIKEEVLDDKMLANCKDLVEKTGIQTTIVFICNSRNATRHLLTIPTYMMNCGGWRQLIRNLAHRTEADAIVAITLLASVEDQQCMTITVETLLNRYGMIYPYERVGQNVVWSDPLQVDPLQVELPGRYGDLLPIPAGMAQA